MDKIVNFLLDYYIWILVVLGIAIVTVIGFLVDSKQKRKKKENLKNDDNNVSEVKTVEPLPEEKKEDVVPVLEAKNQEIPTTIDNVIGGDGVYVNSVNSNQNSQPVNANIPTLNEQKPHFEPKDVNVSIPQAAQGIVNDNGSTIINPQPVNAVHINQQPPIQPVVQQTNYTSSIPVQPQMNIQNSAMQSVNNPTVVPINQGHNLTNQQMINQSPNVQPIQPTVQMSNSIPAINQVSNQQVQQMLNMNSNLNNQMMQQNSSHVENNSGQNNINNQVPSMGINFVTGEQQKNNGDNWNL